MAIVIALSPELKNLLPNRADRQRQEAHLVASELLVDVLECQEQDLAEAIKVIQKG